MKLEWRISLIGVFLRRRGMINVTAVFWIRCSSDAERQFPQKAGRTLNSNLGFAKTSLSDPTINKIHHRDFNIEILNPTSSRLHNLNSHQPR
jgi:hypothetical protein